MPKWRPPSPTPKVVRSLIIGPIVVVAVIALIALGLKAAYGGFAHTYRLTVDMPRASQNLLVGSDVRERGVVIGTVSGMQLVDRRVRLTLTIHGQYRVPADAAVAVDLKTLLGAKYLDLRASRY